MPGGGGAVMDWGSARGGLESTNGAAYTGPPIAGGQGVSFTIPRGSGVDTTLLVELHNCANRLGVCVGLYEPDYIVQEW